MPSSSLLHLDLPLAGMTCAACAARIEKSLNKLPGVTANVNLATESALVTVEPDTTTAAGVIETIRKTGFEVPQRLAELTLYGMTCAACALRIEKVLNKIDGVTATVNFASETARAHYQPGLVSVEQIIAAVQKAGYEASERIDASAEEEKARRADA